MIIVGDKVRTRKSYVAENIPMDVPYNSFDFVVTSIENGLLYNREEKIYAVNPFKVRILKAVPDFTPNDTGTVACTMPLPDLGNKAYTGENGGIWCGGYKIHVTSGGSIIAPEDTEIDVKPVVSDGKYSSYYDLKLNKKTLDFIASNGYVITEMLINDIFDNDFDAGNAFKSLVRAWGAIKGAGKAGNSIEYELNKIEYSINKIREYRINKD